MSTRSADIRSVIGDCARCFEPTPAVSIERFSFSGGAYTVPLCRRHVEMLQRDFYVWAMAGTPAADDVVDDDLDTIGRGTVLFTSEDFLAVRDEEQLVDDDDVHHDDAPVLHLPPPGWDTWTFTLHAMDRRESRGVSPIEAKWCAQDPDFIWPGTTPGTEVRTKQHVKVVVNPQQRRIITVMNRNLVDEPDDMAGTGCRR